MLWSVAARFGFPESEIMGMPLSRLSFWYRGHVEMWRQAETVGRMSGK